MSVLCRDKGRLRSLLEHQNNALLDAIEQREIDRPEPHLPKCVHNQGFRSAEQVLRRISELVERWIFDGGVPES